MLWRTLTTIILNRLTTIHEMSRLTSKLDIVSQRRRSLTFTNSQGGQLRYPRMNDLSIGLVGSSVQTKYGTFEVSPSINTLVWFSGPLFGYNIERAGLIYL